MVGRITRRARPARPNVALLTEEQKKENSRAHMQRYISQPIDDSPFVAKKTQERRDRLWELWVKFCEDMEKDYRTTWVDFVEHPERAEAQAPFRSFLHSYVDNSGRPSVVLDERESVIVRTVNAPSSVKEVWRRLVASADHHVMRLKRRERPSEKHLWKLRWIAEDEGKLEGPAFIMVKWIYGELVGLAGLVDPGEEKTEVTSADVFVILPTLWSRAADIPCDATTRVSFHATILLAAIGGSRPGVLVGLQYEQFSVVVLRDPQKPTETRIIVTAKIRRSKMSQEESQMGRKEKERDKWICFSFTLVPNSIICLGSLILTRAIQDDAFEAGFKTVDEILDRPKLEGVDVVPLRWKQDILKKPIFRITYYVLNSLWYRVLIVAGFRQLLRLYSFRVGAGARLDDARCKGILTDCVRNYIMDHATEVFEQNYQALGVRANLMSLAFKNGAGAPDDPIFERLRDASKDRDPGAPIDISAEERRQFDSRRDVRTLHDTIAKATDKKEKEKLRSKLSCLRQTLYSLKLQEERDEYFKRVDAQRADGLLPTMGNSSPVDSRTKPGLEADVARILDACAAEPTADRDVRCRDYMRSVLRCLEGAPIAAVKQQEAKRSESEVEGGRGEPPEDRPRCLICGPGISFCDRSALTRHYYAKHTEKTTFSRPFPCPECQRSEQREFTVYDPCGWSSHVETVHGWVHTPHLVPRQAPPHPPSCCICTSQPGAGPPLIRHMNNHIHKRFSPWPLPCQACVRSGLGEVRLWSMWEWLEHFKASHMPQCHFCFLCGLLCSSRRGLVKHTNSAHQHEFQTPSPCPGCERRGTSRITLIDGLISWRVHLETAHDEAYYQAMSGGSETAGVGAMIGGGDSDGDDATPAGTTCSSEAQGRKKRRYTNLQVHVGEGSFFSDRPASSSPVSASGRSMAGLEEVPSVFSASTPSPSGSDIDTAFDEYWRWAPSPTLGFGSDVSSDEASDFEEDPEGDRYNTDFGYETRYENKITAFDPMDVEQAEDFNGRHPNRVGNAQGEDLEKIYKRKLIQVASLAYRLIGHNPIITFADNCEKTVADWILLLRQTTLPGDITSLDSHVTTAFQIIDSVICGRRGTYLLRRLAYIQLMRVFVSLEAIIKSDRKNGRIHRSIGYGDASVALDIYMSAQEGGSNTEKLRRELKERKRAGRSWSDLARPSPLFVLLYLDAAEPIVKDFKNRDATTLKLVGSKILEECPDRFIYICTQLAEGAESAARSSQSLDITAAQIKQYLSN